MKIVVTCGPSYAPIDDVRRITNCSTGRVGVTLANALENDHEVYCFKGETATYPGPQGSSSLISFGTNDSLAQQLRNLGHVESIEAVFHVAALADYEIDHVATVDGAKLASQKISSEVGRLHLTLKPATKLLPYLRTWFPYAKIVAWKYELEGSQSDAFAKAWKQIKDNHTDGCVLNGAAYGEGFAFCVPPDEIHECGDLDSLVRKLTQWLNEEAVRSP